jgi:hypothetical protein
MEQTREFLPDPRGEGGTSLLLPATREHGATRRFPLLLVLRDDLEAGRTVDALHREGVLAPMIVAERRAAPGNPAEILESLSARHRILEHPGARWIVGAAGTGVAALRALLDHPDLFGGAACLSASLEGEESAPPSRSRPLAELEGRREFLVARVPGGRHDADSWRERLGPALRWLARR